MSPRDAAPPVVAVLSTAPSREVAERLAGTLVEERLAACVNLIEGVTSIYRWEGAIAREPEVLMVLKTTTTGLDRLRARLVELHPYEVPEVLALDVPHGHVPYLDWVRAEVSPGDA